MKTRYLNDRRSDEEKETHTCLVGGRDTFMSGWGHEFDNEPSASYAFWACTPELRDNVMEHVCNRDEFKNVKVRDEKWIDSTSLVARVSIYTVDANHRYALEGGSNG